MLQVETHGSLAVAWNQSDQRTVQRELSKLSPSLFLDPELDPERGVYWTVKDHVGSGQPPVPVLAWLDRDGTPKPLTLALVEQVKRQEGAADGAARRAAASNEQLKRQIRERNAEDYETVEREHRKRIRAAATDTLPPYWRPRRFGRA